MTERNYDPDFKDMIALLPAVTDFSSPDVVQEMRAARYDMFTPPPEPRTSATTPVADAVG